MDLKSLLTSNQKSAEGAPQREKKTIPPFTKKPSSIDLLVNNDDDDYDHSNTSNSSINTMQSPVLNAKPITQVQRTPSSNSISAIKERNSIISLTNDTDVDIDGKETPSIIRRLSYDLSENNSPVLPKKTISKSNLINDLATSEIKETVEIKESKDLKKDAKKEQKKRITTKKEKEEKTPVKEEVDFSKPRSKSIIKNKPKRYSKPPIWASKWRTSKTREFSNNGEVSEQATSRFRSINDVKPYNDLTRRISNWLYSRIEGVPQEQRRFLELEVRFGQVWDRKIDKRIHLPVLNESILDKDFITNNCTFKSGLELKSYNEINKTLQDLIKKSPKSFKTLISDQVDKQFREASKDQVPRTFRISYDRKTNRVMENIEKKRLDSIFVHTGDLKYDYRLSLSLEIISNENPERFENKTPEVERQKHRTSIIHDKSSTRFDLTRVEQFSKVRNSNRTEDVEKLEVELEIDMPKLISAFDNLDKDSFSFEDLSETLMDNARILNRRLE